MQCIDRVDLINIRLRNCELSNYFKLINLNQSAVGCSPSFYILHWLYNIDINYESVCTGQVNNFFTDSACYKILINNYLIELANQKVILLRRLNWYFNIKFRNLNWNRTSYFILQKRKSRSYLSNKKNPVSVVYELLFLTKLVLFY